MVDAKTKAWEEVSYPLLREFDELDTINITKKELKELIGFPMWDAAMREKQCCDFCVNASKEFHERKKHLGLRE